MHSAQRNNESMCKRANTVTSTQRSLPKSSLKFERFEHNEHQHIGDRYTQNRRKKHRKRRQFYCHSGKIPRAEVNWPIDSSFDRTQASTKV